MASTSPLSTWLLDQKDHLDLRAKRLCWIEDWCPRLVDFSVTITIDNIPFEGRGIGETEDVAFSKAGAEALERAAMRASRFPNSNGFAAHTTRESASIGAIEELVERDAFLCHWLTRTPFLPSSDDVLKADIGGVTVKRLIVRLDDMGVALNLAPMACVKPYRAYICAASGEKASRPFGVAFGMGCKESEEAAINHAVLECLRMTLAWLSPAASHRRPISRKEFERSSVKGAIEHENYALSAECAGLLSEYFEPCHLFANEQLEIKELDFETQVVALPKSVASAPVIIMKAFSSDLQDLYFGDPAESRVNIRRLSRFLARPVSMRDIRLDPHPLG